MFALKREPVVRRAFSFWRIAGKCDVLKGEPVCRDCCRPAELLQSCRKRQLGEASMNRALTSAGLAIGTMVLTAGCAHTGVVPIGQDTYMVARQGWISTQSVAELKGQVFAEANAFCNSQGKS